MDIDDLPIDVATLRRLAAQTTEPPAPLPWRTAELTAAELDAADGRDPPVWDPDVQPSKEAFDAEQARRASVAAWRGLVAADGTPVVGQPLAGGTPTEVVDPSWRLLADAVSRLPDLLATLRVLWPRPEGAADRPAVPPPATDRPLPLPRARTGRTVTVPPGAAGRLDPMKLAVAASACADPDGTGPDFDRLDPDTAQWWTERAAAAIVAYLDA